MPSKDMVEGKSTKVVVFEFEGGGDVAKKTNLGNSLASYVETAVTEDMVVEIIDRNAASKMKKEIELAEINRTSGTYKGPLIADYAVSGSISSASFSSQFKEESIGYNVITNEYYKIPAKFKYKANVNGNLKIYEMPSINVVKTLSFNGNESSVEDAPTKTQSSFFGFSKEREVLGGKSMDSGLVNEAGREAIDSIKVDLKNFFARRGYILEKRILKKNSIFKINLGHADGLKQGDKLVVMQKREDKIAITGQSEVLEVDLSEGVVSNIINSSSAWIIIKDKNAVNIIRLGDSVKMKYKKGFFKPLKNALD
ncbi:hypothetical protein ACFL0U_03110 [Pseudomonadota bacterium]